MTTLTTLGLIEENNSMLENFLTMMQSAIEERDMREIEILSGLLVTAFKVKRSMNYLLDEK